MSSAHLGSLIGAIFGLIYVLVNARELPLVAGVGVAVHGIGAFFGVLVALRRARRPPDPSVAAGRGFGRRYWLVVATEVAAMAAGLVVLNGPLDAPEAGIAWISVVVGLHFFPLAALFGVPFLRRLGAAIAGCGVLGLALAAGNAGAAPIAAVSGVVPGVLLLTASWCGLQRDLRPAARHPG